MGRGLGSRVDVGRGQGPAVSRCAGDKREPVDVVPNGFITAIEEDTHYIELNYRDADLPEQSQHLVYAIMPGDPGESGEGVQVLDVMRDPPSWVRASARVLDVSVARRICGGRCDRLRRRPVSRGRCRREAGA